MLFFGGTKIESGVHWKMLMKNVRNSLMLRVEILFMCNFRSAIFMQF